MRDFKQYADRYADQPFERYLIYFRKKKLKEILSRYDHRLLLEVGCGLDPIFNTISSFEKLCVVEPAEFFFENAVKQKSNFVRPDSVSIKKGLFEDYAPEFRSLKFNFIIISCLLHEIEQPRDFLTAVRDIATDESTIHINVPNAKSFHRLLAVEMGLIRNEFEKSDRNKQFHQHTIFDLESLTSLVEDAGFTVVEKGAFSFKPFTHEQMEKMIQANMLTEQMLEGFYNMEKHLPGLGSEIFVNLRKKQ
jgi:hypothetical protein